MYLKIRPLALALVLFLAAAAACKTESNTGSGPESASPNNTPANTPPPASTPSNAATPPSAAQPAGLSPTDAVRGYYEAGLRNDVASVKRFLSRASLQMMEDVAQRQGKTLEQLLGEAGAMEARKTPPMFSNERIAGDTAYVDIRAPGQPALTMRLVREGGEWKLDFGKPKTGATRR